MPQALPQQNGGGLRALLVGLRAAAIGCVVFTPIYHWTVITQESWILFCLSGGALLGGLAALLSWKAGALDVPSAIGMLIGVAVGVVIDATYDALANDRDRNLFPFEIVAAWAALALPVALGSLLGHWLGTRNPPGKNG